MAFNNNIGGAYNKHILVVDNNIVYLKLATRVLSRFNCTTSGIISSPDALAYLANLRNPRPHLIFVKTYSLGSPDGHEVAQIIRTQPPFIQDPVLQSTAIIGLVPTSPTPYRRKYPFLDDFLQKPIRVNDMRWALTTWARRDPWPPRAKI